ncbi:NUDIX hydrolase [Streptomyces sp. ms191]|uniref:NUDIX hydrolase n=1 Tax=Streptomyces sp. ms191 TaxID=1827978 RepID=UPI0011CE244C|nr:NUDIX hydrolase [Streptomyces sp. ms191]TXS30620.1 NUDIX hydrolase [Streptomyces sp. ms191]
MTDVSRTSTAALLDCVAAQEGTAPVTVEELGRRAGLAPTEAATAVPTVLALVGAFGVLREETTPSGAPAVAVISPAAAYFLRGLAAYIRSGHAVLDNWERAGTEAGPYTDGQVLAGPQFLYLTESRRLALDADAVPLREVEVVQVVVKARHRGGGGRARYLFQYDERARQYQLPGGHVRASDADHRAAAIRELEEELAGYRHRADRDVLTELGTVEAVQPSRTFGAVSGYRVTFFQLRTDAERLLLGPGAHWAAEEEVLDPGFRIGRASLNVTALARLDAGLPGGLTGLPLSVPDPLRRTLRQVVRDRPWEAAGLAVGVIGLVVSLIPLLL